jgi:addiction module RelB/DinJ family antitoxin
MAKTERMTILVEPELKAQANEVFGKIGMSQATAFRMLMRYAVRNNSCPCWMFEPNDETIKAMEDCKNGIGVAPTNLDELRKQFK